MIRYKYVKFVDLPREVKDRFLADFRTSGVSRSRGWYHVVLLRESIRPKRLYVLHYMMNLQTDQWYYGDSRNE